jgi:hypothetical protein
VWEKKSDDGTIHDKDATFSWPDAFTVFIATLNTAPCFAGHCDWRLPNVKELQSIVNYDNISPAVSSAFNNSCVSGCTVLTCSCTTSSPTVGYYRSSTSFIGDDANVAYAVSFHIGIVAGNTKTASGFAGNLVRAVRGGL